MKGLFFVIGLLMIVECSMAQVSLPNTIYAKYTDDAIQLDGRLDEPVWENAVRISNFTQRELNVGEPATEKTEVAIVYTANTLYIGFWGFDREPDNLVAREMKRDFNWGVEDNFEVIIDTYDDDRNGFLFVINPNGARADAQILNNGRSFNKFWNGVWDTRTAITNEGWFAEIAIPFSTLKFKTNLDQQVWGINFERNIRRKREQLLWQGWSRDSELELVNRAGTLTDLDNIKSKTFIEIKPYSIGGAELTPEKSEGQLNAGGDINYLITPTLRMNLTINTDFAQVEADRQQINLTRFPLFFPERREFFLEGQDYFDMGMGNRIIPFYSRRIGLAEDRSTVPIIAGARVLGKMGNTTLGALSMQTASRDSIPSTNYTVVSWRQDVLKQSSIGILSANKYENGRWHSTTGGYGLYSTSELFGDKNLNIGASFTQNINSDDFDARANAHRIYLSYPNDKVEFDMAWQRSATPFNPEVGFLRRENFQEFYTELEWKPRPKNHFKWIRQFSFKGLDMNYFIFDDTGELQSFFYEIRPLGFETRSGESFEFNLQRRAEGLREPFEITEGIVIPEGEYWYNRMEIQAATFSGRNFALDTYFNWGNFFKGKSTQSAFELSWRTSRYLKIAANYEKNWIDLPEGSFDTDLIGNRIEYAVNPNLFGSLFSQWNSEDEEALLNFRLQWIPIIGADFFFIVNQAYDTSGNSWTLERTTVLGKLIWRFVI
ncbi:MAG: carbohydrate binding family 9 domain-containing protein [Cyclobacteriaceae bacterium]|nr:carbohydrate binding family 9 domain-containing protein [Cyclobacteriaceae bacterium]